MGDSSVQLRRISEDLFNKSGFEVFHHAGRRQDINDWVKVESCYIRAMHQLHGYSLHEKIVEADDKAAFANNPGIPLHLLYPGSVQENFQVKFTYPHTAVVEILPHSIDPGVFRSLFRNEDPFRRTPYDENSPYNRYHEFSHQITFPNYIRCALLCGKIEYDEMQKIKSAKALPLEHIIRTHEKQRAYLLQFFIQKFVPDGIGRGGGYPMVYVVADKQLVEETALFLVENPDMYLDLIRGFIPKSTFPNVNRGILEAPSLATKGLVFDNYTSRERIVIQ